MAKYDFRKIEAKWRKAWEKDGTYEPKLKGVGRRKKFYNLMMFPYPSAEGLHAGNMYAFTGADVYGRYQRMRGHDVFEPIGLDGFGIHSENYAIKTGTHPMKFAKVSEKNFYRQLHEIGNGFAWKEHLETYDPEYYKWTQWIFVQMWKHGLAYRKKQAVNWCPSCKTVLADEQVIPAQRSLGGVGAGKCERCGTVVVKRELEQWFFRITKYAEKLLKNLEKLDWSEKVKIAQRNWIGKSEGAEIEFPVRSGVQNFVLLPGWTSTEKDNFYPRLIESLKSRGYAARTVVYKKTAEYSEEIILKDLETRTNLNKNSVLIGHSLGGVMALKLLEKINHPISKLVLVGSFVTPRFKDKSRPFENELSWDFDFKKIRRNCKDIIILHDTSDFIVPESSALEMREKLGGTLIQFQAVAPHIKGMEEPQVLNSVSPYVRVFTTRPDTLFGATYMVLAPEHPFIHVLENHVRNLPEVKKYVAKAANKPEGERIAEGGAKTGVELKGVKAVNPATGKEIPVWVADYVVGGYGTGAIMAVPAHDERDFEFAKKFGLRIEKVIKPAPDSDAPCFSGEGILVNSFAYNGLTTAEARKVLGEKFGTPKAEYRLRDWLLSRQRYWGPPIPMIYCLSCAEADKGEHKDMPGWYAEKEKNLPVKLPFVKDFRPKGKGESPLASVKSFYEVKCPACGSKARRETDVSDTFLDSAWYYLRYPNAHDRKRIFNPAMMKKWFPVDMYIGGAEHSVLHLLYTRFTTMALKDMKLIHFEEPFSRFRAHGLIIKDGAKMSKSKGNVVNPDEYIEKFSADVLRAYLMFLAPFEQGGDFRDEGILGPDRFLRAVFRRYAEAGAHKGPNSRTPLHLQRALHKTIKKVGEDIEALKYNTALSQLMIFWNEAEAAAADNSYLSAADAEAAVKLLAPFAPYMAEEIWRGLLGHKTSIHLAPWPEYDPRLTAEEKITLVIQVNGKMRGSVEAAAGLDEAGAKRLALSEPRVSAILSGRAPRRVIYVPGRLINVVI